MKNLFKSKGLLFLFAASLSLVSCNKDKEKDPAPTELSDKVKGIYYFSELTLDGKTIPAGQSQLKGDIRLLAKTPTTVDAELDFRSKLDDEEFLVFDVSGLELLENGDAIDMIYENEVVAQIKGKKIILNTEDVDGKKFTITATK